MLEQSDSFDMENTDPIPDSSVINADDTHVVPVWPRLRVPVRTSEMIELARTLTVTRRTDSLSYTTANDHDYTPLDLRVPQSNISAPITYGLLRFPSTLPWLHNAVRSELLSRHVVYHPDPIEWSDTVPSRRYVRLRPKAENNSVTTFATYRNMLLVGMAQGQVILYDMNRMAITRGYTIKEKFAVTQIITGKSFDKFFVTCANEFVELSYSEDLVLFRFQCQFLIRKVLANDSPILIIDSNGSVFEYFSETQELGRAVIGVIGLSFNELNYVQELKSFDPHIFEKTRPLLLKNKCTIAVVNLCLNSEPKFTLWRKEALSSNPTDSIIICCFEDKYFYTFIQMTQNSGANLIYVSSIKDIGSSARVEFIKPTSGSLTGMKCSGNYLLVLTRAKNLEIFEARTQLKRYQISFEHHLNDVLVIKNVLVIGTKEGSIILEDLFMESDRVCNKCANTFYFEPSMVFKRCFDNLPQETQTFPIFN